MGFSIFIVIIVNAILALIFAFIILNVILASRDRKTIIGLICLAVFFFSIQIFIIVKSAPMLNDDDNKEYAKAQVKDSLEIVEVAEKQRIGSREENFEYRFIYEYDYSYINKDNVEKKYKVKDYVCVTKEDFDKATIGTKYNLKDYKLVGQVDNNGQ